MKWPFKIFVLFTALLLEMIVLTVSHMLPFMGANKERLSPELLKDEVVSVFQDPVHVIGNLIADNNPLFYIGTIGVIIYTIVVFVRNPGKKGGWEAETENTTHGGARFARPHEIFVKNQIEGFNRKQLLQEFKQSLRESEKQR